MCFGYEDVEARITMQRAERLVFFETMQRFVIESVCESKFQVAECFLALAFQSLNTSKFVRSARDVPMVLAQDAPSTI